MMIFPNEVPGKVSDLVRKMEWRQARWNGVKIGWRNDP
jgi:hypothetical protein